MAALSLLCVGSLLIISVGIFFVTGAPRQIAIVPTPTPTTSPTATATVTLTATNTPPPTPLPSLTLEPTEVEAETAAPSPTSTLTVTPTATEGDSTPTLTVTIEPTPEVVAAANNGMGLTNITLGLVTTTFPINQRIPFEFTVENQTSETIVVGIMGVNLVGTGVFQTSWRNWQMEPGDVTTHADAFSGIGDAGNYSLQLAGCFPTAEDCEAGNGQWMDFDAPVTITIQ